MIPHLAALVTAARLCAALPGIVEDLPPTYAPTCWEIAYRAEMHPGTSAPDALSVAWHESRITADARTGHARGPLQYIPRYWQGAHAPGDWVGPGLDALAHYTARYPGPRAHCHYIYGGNPPRTCTGASRASLARRLRRVLTGERR